MKEKQKIVFIHGGETFNSQEKYFEWLKNKSFDFERMKDKKNRWHRKVGKKIGESFEYINPEMPNKVNAKYNEWKIWFEKVLDYSDYENVIFIGYSLGGTFLLKYFSENLEKIKKIRKMFLVAPAVIKEEKDYDLDTFALDYEKVKLSDSDKIFLYQSKDDMMVLFKNFEVLSELLPKSRKQIFEDKGHFSVEEFDELVEDVKNN